MPLDACDLLPTVRVDEDSVDLCRTGQRD